MKKVLKIKEYENTTKRGPLNHIIFHPRKSGNNQYLSTLNIEHILASIMSKLFTFSLGNCTNNLNITPLMGYPFRQLWICR